MKTCKKCGLAQPLDEFHRLAGSSDGHQPRCKMCAREIARQHYWANRDEALARSAEWRANNRDQKRATDQQRDRSAEYARKREARRDAKALSRRTCEQCGGVIPVDRRADAKYCRDACERTARNYRWRERHDDVYREWCRSYERSRSDQIRTKTLRRRARLLDAYVEDVNPRVLFDRDGGICGICGMPADRQAFHVDHVLPLSRGGEHSYANTQVAHPSCNVRKGARLPDAAAYGVARRT